MSLEPSQRTSLHLSLYSHRPLSVSAWSCRPLSPSLKQLVPSILAWKCRALRLIIYIAPPPNNWILELSLTTWSCVIIHNLEPRSSPPPQLLVSPNSLHHSATEPPTSLRVMSAQNGCVSHILAWSHRDPSMSVRSWELFRSQPGVAELPPSQAGAAKLPPSQPGPAEFSLPFLANSNFLRPNMNQPISFCHNREPSTSLRPSICRTTELPQSRHLPVVNVLPPSQGARQASSVSALSHLAPSLLAWSRRDSSVLAWIFRPLNFLDPSVAWVWQSGAASSRGVTFAFYMGVFLAKGTPVDSGGGASIRPPKF